MRWASAQRQLALDPLMTNDRHVIGPQFLNHTLLPRVSASKSLVIAVLIRRADEK